jgi:predicted kinase
MGSDPDYRSLLFIGIRGSGKTTFFRERFFETHVRISLDLLRTTTSGSGLLEGAPQSSLHKPE